MNISTATFKCSKFARATPLYQYDYGQVLVFKGITLPTAYEVHFSNEQFGESTTQIGDENGVLIPYAYLTSGETVYAWVYLHTSEDDGETVYMVEIPVRKRASITDEQPTPEEQSAITQAIAALQSAVARTDSSAEAAAQSATDAAESAQNAAQSAQDAADSAIQANTSATAAAASESNSAASEANAQASAEAAAASETNAAQSADRAEQAAGAAGWMFFDIVDGNLIMERTYNVPVDFYLQDGNLWMEGRA